MILANNFGELFQNLTKELEETDPAFSFFLWGRARALAQEWFGKEVDLENDILPLFEKEWRLVRSRTFIRHCRFRKNGNCARERKKMLCRTSKKAEYFVPRVLTHTLEDGTQIREIAACDGCVSVSSEEISGGTLDIFPQKTQKETLGIFLLVTKKTSFL